MPWVINHIPTCTSFNNLRILTVSVVGIHLCWTFYITAIPHVLFTEGCTNQISCAFDVLWIGKSWFNCSAVHWLGRAGRGWGPQTQEQSIQSEHYQLQRFTAVAANWCYLTLIDAACTLSHPLLQYIWHLTLLLHVRLIVPHFVHVTRVTSHCFCVNMSMLLQSVLVSFAHCTLQSLALLLRNSIVMMVSHVTHRWKLQNNCFTRHFLSLQHLLPFTACGLFLPSSSES